MRYRLYTTSIKAWNAMLEEINQASKSIYIEMYIFLDDTGEEHDFIGALCKKASEGVNVVIVADAFGSKELKRETISSLRNAGAELIFFSHWLRHIHRKILIVDEKIAFIGGVNIGKHFTTWNDLQLKLGGHIVKKFIQSFSYTYGMAGGKDATLLAQQKKRFAYKLQYWLIEHWPIRNIYTLKNRYIEAITGSQESIKIVTPYFTPPRWMISILDNAVQRGVRVEIIIPEKVDWRIMNRVNYRYMYELHKLGISFFLSKEMNHAKLLLIDDSMGIIGSQNMDILSFSLNTEIGLFFKDRKLLKELSGVFNQWKNNSKKFTASYFKNTWHDRAVLLLIKILYPIL
jgi:cardiolipin synthase